jgi:hypothetical protein
MVNVDEAFEHWLNEPWVGGQTRLEFAKRRGMEVEGMRWAFSSGWVLGQRQAVKDLQNV